jgi:hypothetical protein
MGENDTKQIVNEVLLSPEQLPAQVIEVDKDVFKAIRIRLSQNQAKIQNDEISLHSINTPVVNECASACLIALVFEPSNEKVHQAHLYPDAVDMRFPEYDRPKYLLDDLVTIEEKIIANDDPRGAHIFLFGQGIFKEDIRSIMQEQRKIPIDALLKSGVDVSRIHDYRNNGLSISDNTIWDPEDKTIYLWRRIV